MTTTCTECEIPTHDGARLCHGCRPRKPSPRNLRCGFCGSRTVYPYDEVPYLIHDRWTWDGYCAACQETQELDEG